MLGRRLVSLTAGRSDRHDWKVVADCADKYGGGADDSSGCVYFFHDEDGFSGHDWKVVAGTQPVLATGGEVVVGWKDTLVFYERGAVAPQGALGHGRVRGCLPGGFQVLESQVALVPPSQAYALIHA